LRLAERLLPIIPDLRFALPPDGVKDLRQWVQSSPEEIGNAIASAPRVTPKWLNQAWDDVRRNRQQAREQNWAHKAVDLSYSLEEGAGICEFEGLEREAMQQEGM
jgi:hypothetical protein